MRNLCTIHIETKKHGSILKQFVEKDVASDPDFAAWNPTVMREEDYRFIGLGTDTKPRDQVWIYFNKVNE